MPKEGRKTSKDEKNRSLDGNEDDLSSTSSSVDSKSVKGVDLDVDRLLDFADDDLEIDADSVLSIEEIPEDMCLESSLDEIKCSAKNILYEFPNDDDDEENEGHVFTSSKRARLPQNTEIPNMNELDSPDDNHRIKSESQTRAELWKVPHDKGNKKISPEKYSSGFNDYSKDPSNKVPNTAEAVKDPGTPVYEYINLWPKSSNETLLFDDNVEKATFLDHSSDEFADVEDNVKDSSSDNSQPIVEGNSGQVSSSQVDTDKEQSDEYLHKLERITPPIVATEYSAESSSSEEFNKTEQPTLSGFTETKPNVIDVYPKVFRKPSCPFPKVNNRFEIHSETKAVEAERRKKIIQTMPAIPEMAELDENNKRKTWKDSQTSASRINPLKMKAKVSTKKNRCGVCNVRLGLCAIRCRCGNFYCAKHRYDREHNCTFDYRRMGEEEIRKNNPKIVGEKVRKL